MAVHDRNAEKHVAGSMNMPGHPKNMLCGCLVHVEMLEDRICVDLYLYICGYKTMRFNHGVAAASMTPAGQVVLILLIPFLPQFPLGNFT